MGISQIALARLHLFALLLGAVLGAVYDALRITRIFLGAHYRPQTARQLAGIRLPWLPPRRERGERKILGTVVFFEDFLFCILAGVSLILLLYEANNGKFRTLVVLCAAAGFFAYRATLGNIVMLLSEGIAFVLGTIARYLLFFLTAPIRLVWRVLSRAAERVVLCFLYAERRRKRRQYTRRMLACADEQAREMLPPQEMLGKRSQRSQKGGRSDGTKAKKAIQSQPGDASVSGGDGRDVHRRVRQ